MSRKFVDMMSVINFASICVNERVCFFDLRKSAHCNCLNQRIENENFTHDRLVSRTLTVGNFVHATSVNTKQDCCDNRYVLFK